MYEHLIRGGLVVDGSGAPGRRADVAISGGRVAAIGDLRGESSRETIDAGGMVVAPGFIDVHTHYDAQLFWDGYATPSSQHGVTTVFGGNCGFTLAPLKQRDADYTRRMMAQVEGMPLPALEQGLEWNWESFAGYLDALEGRVAVNAGFLVGHCALRRYVLGEASMERESRPDEVREMIEVLRQSLKAGALGFSTTRSHSHPDHDGRPVPSRQAAEDEVLELCATVGEYPGTTLEAIVSGCIRGFDDSEVELLARMSAAAGRALNWNVLGLENTQVGYAGLTRRERFELQMRPSVRARELGGRVVALTMPVGADLNMSFATYCALWLIPGWREVLTLPPAEKRAKLRDREVQASLAAAGVGTGLDRFALVEHYRIGETVAPANARYEGRLVGDIARERGVDPWDALLDIEEADDYRTVLWPVRSDKDIDWDLRVEVWEHDDVLIGGSDAGAHLDRLLASPYPTRVLAGIVRERGLLTMEEAIRLMTDKPARFYGLQDRGRLVVGAHADVVVFDPETVDSGIGRRVFDLPGDSLRLTADAVGVARVMVNGHDVMVDGRPTGDLPGTVLRSGRDTETVATR
jgi:N-acyl-D-aspartate/D-glutamate deacylase